MYWMSRRCTEGRYYYYYYYYYYYDFYYYYYYPEGRTGGSTSEGRTVTGSSTFP